MSDATPLFAEMATPGTSFTGTWQERSFLENQEIARALGWRSVPSPKMIVDAANDFAEAQIEAQGRYAETAGLSGIVNTVSRLREELAKAREASLSCLLCLGWGGGFVSKSAYLETEQDSFRKILRTVPALESRTSRGRYLSQNPPRGVQRRAASQFGRLGDCSVRRLRVKLRG